MIVRLYNREIRIDEIDDDDEDDDDSDDEIMMMIMR